MKTSVKVLLIVCIVIFFHGFSAFATHQMGSEITYKHITGFIYEITITTYTYSPSPADRPELQIDWGDGFSSILPRDYYVEITNTLRKNIYIGVHVFPSEGTYDISFEDPNRNYGIVNIPNSVNVPMYVESRLVINNNLGANNSPLLLSDMYGIGYVNNVFTYNMGAYDADGDSLAYKLTYCRGLMGFPIPGFSLPEASTTFEINPENGDLLWDSPILQGQYCIAILVEEWRQGVMIGRVIRDMNINIDTANEDDIPVITTISDTIVFPGEVLSFDVSASAPNLNDVSLIGYGGPFIVTQNPAQFSDVIIPVPVASSIFSWEISSSHVREQAYYVYFLASTGSNWLIKESYKTVKILVQEYQSLKENSGSRIIEVNFNNPVKKYLYLNVDCENPMQLFYNIYSFNGESLLFGNLGKQKSFSKCISFADFRTGIYILQIHDDNQILVIKKIIKME